MKLKNWKIKKIIWILIVKDEINKLIYINLFIYLIILFEYYSLISFNFPFANLKYS